MNKNNLKTGITGLATGLMLTLGAADIKAQSQNNNAYSMNRIVNLEHQLNKKEFGTTLDYEERAGIEENIINWFKKYTSASDEFDHYGKGIILNNGDMELQTGHSFYLDKFKGRIPTDTPDAIRFLLNKKTVPYLKKDMKKEPVEKEPQQTKPKTVDSWASRISVGYMGSFMPNKEENLALTEKVGGTAFLSVPLFKGLSAEAGITFNHTANYMVQKINELNREKTNSGRTYVQSEVIESIKETKLLGTLGASLKIGNKIPVTFYGGINAGSETENKNVDTREEVFFNDERIGEGTDSGNSQYIPGNTKTGMNGFYYGVGVGSPSLSLRVGGKTYNNGFENVNSLEVGLVLTPGKMNKSRKTKSYNSSHSRYRRR